MHRASHRKRLQHACGIAAIAFAFQIGTASDKEIKKAGSEPKFFLHIIAALETKLP